MDMIKASEGCSEFKPARRLRVMHIVSSEWGHRFSGQTHYLFSLLSGWNDKDVGLDIWGSDVRPLNVGTGTRDYKLAAQLWPPGRSPQSVLSRMSGYARQLAFLVVHAQDFDIAHFHKLGWDTLVSPLVLSLFGKKAVYTASLYGSDNPSAVRESRGGRLAATLLRHFDGIVALSPLLAEDYLASGAKNVACLPNFLALPQLERDCGAGAREQTRRELSIPHDATVLLFIGAVIRRKGVDLLAECFARLAPRRDDLWLVILGPNSGALSDGETFVQAVRTTIARAGVAPRVVWTGMVRDKNVLVRYYSAADIFVLPTRAEGLANVLIEASAAGLPIVATDLRGITDVPVADGETGFLTPVEDVDALTQAVERLITDPALRAKMGQSGRAHSKQFGFEDYCRKLKTFYLNVAGSS